MPSFVAHRALFVAALSLLFTACEHAQAPWPLVGPFGGDARAFAAVPADSHHLYLGTTNSWIYESHDQGAHWQRLKKLDEAGELIVDNLLVDEHDAQTVLAAAWRLGSTDGGLWISHDAGSHWAEVADLHGQSIRSLAQAPSNSSIFYAGTLEGVFASADGGLHWHLISPAKSQEIHEIESLAIDPTNAQVVYAGTWHLPWKTTDGGKTWQNIKNGVIEDSDVFSILVDPTAPRTVYASACSGIYKSESAGQLFHKVQGIPSSARRTRVLMMDPNAHETVYAGTTEGLYKTTNGGRTFKAMTGDDVIVNDVFVDPTDSQTVLIAADRAGVLISHDGGQSFRAANDGLSARKVEALLADTEHPDHLVAGVVNDKNYGGVFESFNGGQSWQQLQQGLDGADVYSLSRSAEGTLVAGTNHGIYAWNAEHKQWQGINTIANTVTKPYTETIKGKRIDLEKQVKAPTAQLSGRVPALDVSGSVWVAATAAGLLSSHDQGATWQGGPVMGTSGYVSVAARANVLVAARLDGVAISLDGGGLWRPLPTPSMLTRIHRVAFASDGTLWLGAREGVYYTTDLGKTWMWAHRLPVADIDELAIDPANNHVLVSSRAGDAVYVIDPKTLGFTYHAAGSRLALVRAAGGHLIAATVYDGLAIEPRSR